MSLSQSELYTLAKSVGLSDGNAKTAAAVAMAESGGNPNAHNANTATGDDSYGLWQINMLGALGPARRVQFGISSNNELYNPPVNARAMAILSSTGANFTPWSVYKSGSYRRFLTTPVEDKSSDPGWLSKLGDVVAWPIGGLGGDIKDTASAAAATAQIVAKAAAWSSNPQNWIRVAYVVGGSVVIIAGLVMILGDTKAGRTVLSAAPAGRVKTTLRKVA